MYVVKFYNRTTHSLTDERTVCYDASMAGFKKTLEWAEAVAEPSEYVGTIERQIVEKP